MRIDATDVTKTYGAVTALDGLTLSIPSGSTFGLLGTNGAGKTTLFRLLIGHETPDSGRLRIGETTVVEAGPRIRERVGYLPERVGFPDELTASEVLRVTGRVRGLSDVDERVAGVLETVGLGDDSDRPVEGFSNGMRRRLGLATALLPRPDVLILDEPTAGLDPLGVVTFHRIVEAVSERTDATVVVCSHALAEVERLCDRVAVLDDGQLLAAGDLAELAANTGESRTVRVHVADPVRRQEVADLCRRAGEPRVDGETVTVDVVSDEALDLLCDLDVTVGLDRVELGSGGLESTFESVVTSDGDPVAGTGTAEEPPAPAATETDAEAQTSGRVTGRTEGSP